MKSDEKSYGVSGKAKSTKLTFKNAICILILFIVVFSLIVAIIFLIAVIFISQNNLSKTNFPISIFSTIPSNQSFRNGFIELECSYPGELVIRPNIQILLDGIRIFSLKRFPFNLEIPTHGLSDGNHTVSVIANSSDDRMGLGLIVIATEDPKLSVIQLDYQRIIYPGITFTIEIQVNGSAIEIVANFTSLFGATHLPTSSGNNGDILTLSVFIPATFMTEENFYIIPLNIIGNNSLILNVSPLQVFFQVAKTNPFTIEEGIIMFSSFPLTNATNVSDPSLNLTLPPDFEISITTGESITIPLQTETISTFSEVLVGWEGFGQHFIIPISSLLQSNINRRSEDDAVLNRFSFMLTLPTGALQTGARMTTSMFLRVRNAMGALGPVLTTMVILSTSQQGSLHVRLTWYVEVDLDLHVVDPNGEEIFYGNRRSTQQPGFLDLDSNPACSLDRIKIENIYFEMAITGKYIVRVDLYASCSVNSSINFEVFAKGCNISETITGNFSPSESDGGGRGSGRTVLTFIAECNEYLAQGTVSYKTGSERRNPLGAMVRVVDSEGNIFGESQVQKDSTDEKRGIFYFTYNPIDVSAGVYLELLSDNGRIQVRNHAENVHVYRESNSIVPSMESSSFRDVVINKGRSGAFHILYTMTRMLPHYLAYGGTTSDYPLIVDWEQFKPAKGSPLSHFSPSTKIISIQGNWDDPDEFDDSVLMHEFGHLINDRTGAEITGSGPHGNYRISPNFAFSEGFATYLGQMELKNFIYIDRPSPNIDLSNLRPSLLGTSASGHSSGFISEYAVAGAALKMDFSLSLAMLIRQSLTDPNKLLLRSNYDKLGDPTAVDFADMVSLIGCNLNDENKDKLSKLLDGYSLPWITEDGFCT